MGPHCPRDGLYGVPTVIWRYNRNFHFLRKTVNRKFAFWGMVIFDGFDPFFFLPNGTPLAPRWTLVVPTVFWRHNHNFHFLGKSDDRGVVENSNFGAW